MIMFQYEIFWGASAGNSGLAVIVAHCRKSQLYYSCGYIKLSYIKINGLIVLKD